MIQKDLFQTTTFSVVDIRANRSRLQDLEKEKKMTGTSGRASLELLHKKDPLGSFAKMFMVTLPWVSTKCSLTWKVKATPQGRLLFLLVPKMLPTEEIDSGLSQKMWATPNTMDHLPPRSEEATKKMQEGHRKGRSRPSNLREQVDEKTMRLWPTPNAWDGSRGPRSKKNLIEKDHQINLISAVKDAQDPEPVHLWPTPTANQAGEGEFLNKLTTKNGEPPKRGERAYNPETGQHVQVTLNRAVKMWPTPMARDYKGARKPETLKNAGRTPTNSLPDMVAHQMWPTPTANEHHAGRTWQGQMQKMLGNHPDLGKTKTSGSLNPTWVEWLMGYPKGWTDLKD